MALTVGTDTYISQADATTYVGDNYASTSDEYVAWAALSSDDKDAWLRKALKVLDRQPYIGIKAEDTQTLEFPRAIRSESKREDLPTLHLTRFNSDWVVQTEVPQVVKDAQVEEAISLTVGVSKRIELQRQGVKSFRLGNLSESYGGTPATRITSFEARELLKPYLAGVVPIS